MKPLSPRTRRKIVWTLILAVILGVVAWIYRDQLDRESIIAFGKRLPAPVFVAAFMILPLAGFPISILLVLAGIRFGFTGGMIVATVGVFAHNAAAFRLTHGWFRHRLRKRLDRAGYGIPAIDPKHQVWFTALFAAIHGPPYAAKLYLLALTDVTFRVYFWVGAPVYILFCFIPVGAGSAVQTLDMKLIYLLVAMSAALMVAGIALKRRFARKTEA